MGTPRPTEANQRAARRLVNQILEEHGIRPHQRASIVHRAVALILIPSDDELEAVALSRSAEAENRSRGFWTTQ
jgi:hypothetical protein